MVIGLDIDGTINRHPKVFALLSDALMSAGREVIVITFREDRKSATDVFDTAAGVVARMVEIRWSETRDGPRNLDFAWDFQVRGKWNRKSDVSGGDDVTLENDGAPSPPHVPRCVQLRQAAQDAARPHTAGVRMVGMAAQTQPLHPRPNAP